MVVAQAQMDMAHDPKGDCKLLAVPDESELTELLELQRPLHLFKGRPELLDGPIVESVAQGFGKEAHRGVRDGVVDEHTYPVLHVGLRCHYRTVESLWGVPIRPVPRR